ncbi:transcriptional regulator [Fusibacter tunisiensis]|uniref:DNA-binding protein n=1 Tax=Fusibacter tunisiensis TaxID=1008308 RepID=A0ABS2MT51_9FIRM|nr:transcriptional regulator [Fusibacter tunisiensis]MBM7562525.1 hypothetical protein [Fusibacter tunisiensis]
MSGTNKSICFYNAKDVSDILGISLTSAYRIIKNLNDNLKKDGYIIVPGRISKKYFETKVMM